MATMRAGWREREPGVTEESVVSRREIFLNSDEGLTKEMDFLSLNHTLKMLRGVYFFVLYTF